MAREPRPESAIKLLDPDGNDNGDWIWCLHSKSRPHAYGAYDEMIMHVNAQTIAVTVSRHRKKVRVRVNGVEWTP